MTTTESARPTFTPSAETPLRVALVEDKREVMKSWCRLIDAFPDIECICQCSSGEDALRQIPAARPDVILMDIFLPRMSGIECTARLKVLLPQSQIIILTAAEDDELVFLALEAGANGYLLKRTKPSDLRAALLEVLGGGAPMTSEIARRVVESFRPQGKSRSPDDTVSLTAREEEILVLLSKGYSNKEIADRLTLSVETVRSHLKHSYEKMHVRSRTEAVVRYMTSKSGPTKRDADPGTAF